MDGRSGFASDFGPSLTTCQSPTGEEPAGIVVSAGTVELGGKANAAGVVEVGTPEVAGRAEVGGPVGVIVTTLRTGSTVLAGKVALDGTVGPRQPISAMIASDWSQINWRNIA
jgi:hypothetical protein